MLNAVLLSDLLFSKFSANRSIVEFGLKSRHQIHVAYSPSFALS